MAGGPDVVVSVMAHEDPFVAEGERDADDEQHPALPAGERAATPISATQLA